MASTPAVLVGMPVSTDEVRTDLAVVQGAVVQGTPLTRQLSQSAISEASVNGVAETEGERERRMAEFMAEWEKKVEEEIKAEDSITKLSGWLTALIVMPILVGEYPFFRGAILPIILEYLYKGCESHRVFDCHDNNFSRNLKIRKEASQTPEQAIPNLFSIWH